MDVLHRFYCNSNSVGLDLGRGHGLACINTPFILYHQNSFIQIVISYKGFTVTGNKIYSTTKETHQSLLGAIMEIRIKKLKYIYTIFSSNQFCIIVFNYVTVLLKSVHAILQCLDKGLF